MFQKIFYLLLFTFYFSSLFPQRVEVLEKGETANLKKQPKIDYLFTEPDNDERIFYVATVNAIGFKNVAQLFDAIRLEAGRMGANCFRLEEYIPGEKNSSLTLRTYFALQDYLDENDQLNELNVIYVFGNDKFEVGNISFKINGKKTEINNRTYLRYENEIGGKIKINKGGFTGTSVTIKGEENRPATYLSLSGFNVVPAAGYSTMNFGFGVLGGASASVSLSTGKINYIDPNLANLLLLIWKESE